MPPQNKTNFESRIASGQSVVIAEVHAPQTGDAAAVRATAKEFAGKVHALGICDNHHKVGMSALVAASLVAAEGVEPILHVATRDRNRIALVSDALGASALGIHNVLCTTGTHTTLGAFRSARGVHDIDAVQLIQTYAGLSKDASLVGEKGLGGAQPFCIGGVAAPFADPQELQVTRLAKKVKAGARFLITQPIFDLERFGQWWQEVTRRGLDKQVAIVAGIRVLTSSDEAAAYAKQRPSPLVPKAVLARLAEGDPQQQKKAGIAIACETIAKLAAMPGLRGFEISADDHAAALTVIAEAGLRVN